MKLDDVFHVVYSKIDDTTYDDTMYSIKIEDTIKGLLINNKIYFDSIYKSKENFTEKYELELQKMKSRQEYLEIKKKTLMRCLVSVKWYFLYLYSIHSIFNGLMHWNKMHEKIYEEIEDIIHEKSTIESELEVFPKYIDYFYECQKNIVDLLIELKFDVHFVNLYKHVMDIVKDI